MSSYMFSLEENVFVKTVLSSYNVLVHILMGAIVGISLLFAVKTDYNATSVPENIILLHILLCVPGFTLLMSQSLLAMTSYNTWSSSLSKSNKRRAHWVIQIVGSGMGLVGSIVIMIYKDVNFNTPHGKCGLVAVIFTMLNIMIGAVTLFANQLGRFIPPILIKIVHIVMGIVTYATASACLCYAFNKTMFKLWTSENVASGVIAISAIFAVIILVNPLVTLCKKFISIIKKGLEN